VFVPYEMDYDVNGVLSHFRLVVYDAYPKKDIFFISYLMDKKE
jgi:hypothetical protein